MYAMPPTGWPALTFGADWLLAGGYCGRESGGRAVAAIETTRDETAGRSLRGMERCVEGEITRCALAAGDGRMERKMKEIQRTHLVSRRIGYRADSSVHSIHVVGRFQHVVQFRRHGIIDEPNQRGNGDISVDCRQSHFHFDSTPQTTDRRLRAERPERSAKKDSPNDMIITTQRYCIVRILFFHLSLAAIPSIAAFTLGNPLCCL